MKDRALKWAAAVVSAVAGLVIVAGVTAWLMRPGYADHPCYDPGTGRVLPPVYGNDC